MMIDVSQTGARVVIEGSLEGLDLKEFFLLLSSTGLAYRRCKLVRVAGDQIGVAFLTQDTFAKKKAVEILKVPYLSRDEAAEKIPAAFAKYYQDSYPAIWAQRQAEIKASAKGVLAVYDRNIFPEMKVTWGVYPMNLGHDDSPGCFRCHDGSHSSKSGDSITQDCNACHNLLATDEKNPKVLTDLGIEEKK